MSLTKVPQTAVPWPLAIFGTLGIVGLYGLLSQSHVWPFNRDQAPSHQPALIAPPANTPPAPNPPPSSP